MGRAPIYELSGDDAVVGRRIIAAAIRKRRLGLGLSQRQLAWRVGVDQSTISRIETGQLRGIKYVTLCQIIGSLRIRAREFVPGEPPAPTRKLPGARSPWPA